MIKAAGVAEVTDADFEAEVIGAELPVLVEFTADWCPPCRQMAPVLSALAAEESERLKVVQLNVDINPLTTNAYRVLSMPTFMVFRERRAGEVDGGGHGRSGGCWRSSPTCSSRSSDGSAPAPKPKKSPERLRSGDFFAYIQWFATSVEQSSRGKVQ